MWSYTDDENLWLSPAAPERRLVPQDQISPELIAYHTQRARQLRSQALAEAAGSLFDALRHPFKAKSDGEPARFAHWTRVQTTR
ncbi:RSP_7527 family protein [Dongia sp.]|uniref:RSP_7527 family protein n=1 Tax=Dongia sp. TaxID=1977262 RepID=UPI0035ADEF39